MKGMPQQETAPCGGPRRHPEPCQVVECRISARFPGTAMTSTSLLVAGTKVIDDIHVEEVKERSHRYDYYLDIEATIQARCWDGNRDLRRTLVEELPDRMDCDGAGFEVIEKQSI